jgi:hypothetical protein
MSEVKFHPLLCSPSPRDIHEVMEAHKKLPYDMLYAKYFTERIAYPLLRQYFLEHKQYTHMILCPDDLVIKPEDMKQIKHDVLEGDYPVISGICNVDLDINKDSYTICLNIPHPVRPITRKEERIWKHGSIPAFALPWRWYAWYNDDLIKKEQELQKSIIIRVWHSGFALQAIRRDVVEQIPFQTDAVANGLEHMECSGTDIIYSNSLAASGIPQYADPRIKMVHLRHSGPIEITLGDGFLKFYPKLGTYTSEQKQVWEEYEPPKPTQ